MSIEERTYSRLLRISDVQKLNDGDTPTDFAVNLSRMSETNNIVRIVVKGVDFPNNFYNITELNNTFTMETSFSGFVSITPIPPGFYSLSQVIAYVTADITSQLGGSTLTIVQDTHTRKLTFAIDTQTFELFKTGEVIGFNAIDTTLSEVLGITTSTGIVTSHVADRIPNLAGVTKAYVHSLSTGESNLVDGDVEVHDVIAEVPVNVVWGAWNYYESSDDELDSINYRTPRNIDNIRIQLKDIQNRVLKLEGGHVTITLKLYYLN